MTSFAHDEMSGPTTLSEIERIYKGTSPDRFLGCYAYATQSGFRSFDLGMGSDVFWKSVVSRWLFGIDYGRTDPRALREIAKQENTNVRIFDGAWVVNQEGFLPRRDFHAKVAIMENSKTKTSGIVLGSGNFSNNGLERSVEAGTAFTAKSDEALKAHIYPVKDVFEKFWSLSTPLQDIIDVYEERKSDLIEESDKKRPKTGVLSRGIFWIEAGYVTPNRNEKPGNQIFFPRGFREFFGYKLKENEEKNSIIGSVTFKTPVGDPVTNNLRLNRNSMEKISLPIPETHGFGVYDGKVLVFEEIHGEFLMKTFEAIEFDKLYGDRLVDVKRMSGGRRYGAIV
jgi:HKD family nuclease